MKIDPTILNISDQVARCFLGDSTIGLNQLRKSVKHVKPLHPLTDDTFDANHDYNEEFDQLTQDIARVLEKYVETVGS